MNDFYIITTHHEALWPRGVLLFWAANRNGYSSFLERAGRYSEEEAKKICAAPRGDRYVDYMVPCEVIEAEAVRVVDIDKLNSLIEGADTRRTPPDGVPCSHPGCLSHISHACEGCGRIGGKRDGSEPPARSEAVPRSRGQVEPA